jgi:hypothetical protein
VIREQQVLDLCVRRGAYGIADGLVDRMHVFAAMGEGQLGYCCPIVCSVLYLIFNKERNGMILGVRFCHSATTFIG